jgi:hypothetical protein
MCTRASVPLALIAGVPHAGGHGEPADEALSAMYRQSPKRSRMSLRLSCSVPDGGGRTVALLPVSRFAVCHLVTRIGERPWS